MPTWLGDILHWLGRGVAVPFLAIAVANLGWGEGDLTTTIIFGYLVAVLARRRGLRYLLAGRR